jgi:hypothetical protein
MWGMKQMPAAHRPKTKKHKKGQSLSYTSKLHKKLLLLRQIQSQNLGWAEI